MWKTRTYVGLIGLTIVVVAQAIANKGLRDRLSVKESEVAELEERLQIDPLTGLCNRHGFDSRLAQEVARSRRTGSGLGLVFLDADRFGDVNNLLGHIAGDEVLKRLARVLASGARSTEMVARFGGDEFAAILVGADIETAQAAAERYRSLIKVAFAGDQVPLTVSAGVATLRQLDAPSAEGLIAAADVAMYQLKHGGSDG